LEELKQQQKTAKERRQKPIRPGQITGRQKRKAGRQIRGFRKERGSTTAATEGAAAKIEEQKAEEKKQQEAQQQAGNPQNDKSDKQLTPVKPPKPSDANDRSTSQHCSTRKRATRKR